VLDLAIWFLLKRWLQSLFVGDIINIADLKQSRREILRSHGYMAYGKLIEVGNGAKS